MGNTLPGSLLFRAGGLYLANVLSRMLGLSGDQTISLGISKYDREHPMQAGDFKIGQSPDASQVAGQVVLLVDEVHDSGRTAEWARNALVELGAAAVFMAVIHYKPGANATGYEPDFYIEPSMDGSTTRGSLSTCSAASIRPLCEDNPGKALTWWARVDLSHRAHSCQFISGALSVKNDRQAAGNVLVQFLYLSRKPPVVIRDPSSRCGPSAGSLEARRWPGYTPLIWPVRSSTPLSEHSSATCSTNSVPRHPLSSRRGRPAILPRTSSSASATTSLAAAAGLIALSAILR